MDCTIICYVLPFPHGKRHKIHPLILLMNVNRKNYIVYDKNCVHTYIVTYLLLDSIMAHNIHHHALK